MKISNILLHLDVCNIRVSNAQTYKNKVVRFYHFTYLNNGINSSY